MVEEQAGYAPSVEASALPESAHDAHLVLDTLLNWYLI